MSDHTETTPGALGRLCGPRRNPMCALALLLALELALAYAVPAHALSGPSPLAAGVVLLEGAAPVLARVAEYAPAQAGPIRLFMAITLLLVPLKVLLFYWWLNGDRNGVYRFLVVSPLTDTKPAGGDNFVTDPVREKHGRKPRAKRRSVFSRVVWSTLIIAITAGGWWALLASTSPSNSTGPTADFYADLVASPLIMWLVWSIKNLAFVSFLTAVSLSILRDYMLVIVRRPGIPEGGSSDG